MQKNLKHQKCMISMQGCQSPILVTDYSIRVFHTVRLFYKIIYSQPSSTAIVCLYIILDTFRAKKLCWHYWPGPIGLIS